MGRSDFAVSTYDAGGSSDSGSAWNPKNWTRRIWLIIATVIVLIVVVIVGAVVGVRATRDNNGGNNSYPDYFKLNYTLIDTCESGWIWLLFEIHSGVVTEADFIDSGTSFFDKFNYFNTYDPGMPSLSNFCSPTTNNSAFSRWFCSLCRPILRRPIRRRTSHPIPYPPVVD